MMRPHTFVHVSDCVSALFLHSDLRPWVFFDDSFLFLYLFLAFLFYRSKPLGRNNRSIILWMFTKLNVRRHKVTIVDDITRLERYALKWRVNWPPCWTCVGETLNRFNKRGFTFMELSFCQFGSASFFFGLFFIFYDFFLIIF